MTRRSWALFAAMCVIWGIPYLMIRVAVRDVDPGTLVFFRTAIGALALLPLALHERGFRLVVSRWKPVVAFAVIEMAIPWAMLGQAETRLPSAVTGLLIAFVPFVIILISRVTGQADQPGARAWVGLLVGLLGLVLLVGLDFSHLGAVPLLEVLVTVVGYAIGPMIMNRYLSELPRFSVVCAALIVAAVLWAPFGATHLPAHLHARPLASVIALGLVCTALAFVTFFALVAAIGPGRATIITYVNTAVAVLVGVVLLGEDFTLGMAIGFPLILVGSFLAARGDGTTSPAEPLAELAESVDADVAAGGTEGGSDDTGAVLAGRRPLDGDAVQRLRQ